MGNIDKKITLEQLKEKFPIDCFCVRTSGALDNKHNYRRKGFVFIVKSYEDKAVVDDAGNMHLAKNIERCD